MKYIDAEKLIAELRKHLIPTVLDRDYDEWEKGEDNGFLKAIDIITSIQQEQPMPDSTKLIELWHEDKEMLKEKDFRDDPWRLAYNAFMCGFGRGIAVNKQDHFADASKMEKVDLGKEIEMYISSKGLQDYAFLVHSIARYFWNKGYNARKEE